MAGEYHAASTWVTFFVCLLAMCAAHPKQEQDELLKYLHSFGADSGVGAYVDPFIGTGKCFLVCFKVL